MAATTVTRMGRDRSGNARNKKLAGSVARRAIGRDPAGRRGGRKTPLADTTLKW